MLASTSLTVIPSHVLQPALQPVASRISLLPRGASSTQIRADPGLSQPHPSTIQAPTDEEIEAALADARESDPSGQNDDFYYLGYQSREDLADIPTAPIQRQDEGGYDIEPRFHYHSVDNTWRVYPPQFSFPEDEASDEEDEEAGGPTAGKGRKRDKLKRLGVQLFKRVSAMRKNNRGSGKDTTPASR